MTKRLIIKALREKGLKAQIIICKRECDQYLGQFWTYTVILDEESKSYCNDSGSNQQTSKETLWWIHNLPSKTK